MKLWTDDGATRPGAPLDRHRKAADHAAPSSRRVPWWLTPGGLAAIFLVALGVGLCDPLWSSMPWSGR